MPEDIDWSLATHRGVRRRQLAEFYALPFREKLAVLERSAAVAAFFASRRAARGLTAHSPQSASPPVDSSPSA